jgi:hypothetical protein
VTGPTHAVIGAAGAVPVAAATHAPLLPVVVAGAVVARLPDLDLKLGLPHRGPTHSLAAAVAAAVAAGARVRQVWPGWALAAVLVVLVAWLSHLAADLINPTPMALLWPLWWGRLRPGFLPAASEASLGGRIVELATLAAVVGLAGPVVWQALRVSARVIWPFGCRSSRAGAGERAGAGSGRRPRDPGLAERQPGGVGAGAEDPLVGGRLWADTARAG